MTSETHKQPRGHQRKPYATWGQSVKCMRTHDNMLSSVVCCANAAQTLRLHQCVACAVQWRQCVSHFASKCQALVTASNCARISHGMYMGFQRGLHGPLMGHARVAREMLTCWLSATVLVRDAIWRHVNSKRRDLYNTVCKRGWRHGHAPQHETQTCLETAH